MVASSRCRVIDAEHWLVLLLVAAVASRLRRCFVFCSAIRWGGRSYWHDAPPSRRLAAQKAPRGLGEVSGPHADCVWVSQPLCGDQAATCSLDRSAPRLKRTRASRLKRVGGRKIGFNPRRFRTPCGTPTVRLNSRPRAAQLPHRAGSESHPKNERCGMVSHGAFVRNIRR